MKRDKNLVTLSWEHHNGLSTAFRVKQGLKKKADATEIIHFIKYIWDNELRIHFETEEKYLAPAIRSIEKNETLYTRFKSDHIEIEKLVEEINKDTMENSEQIGIFAEMLEKHIRFEERELFPFIEKNIDPQILKDIGKKLKIAHQPACTTWKPDFWT